MADDELDFRLETFGAVQIEGPKWCGKTTTAEMKAKSVLKLQEQIDDDPGFLDMAKARPAALLPGDNPRLCYSDRNLGSLREIAIARKLFMKMILSVKTWSICCIIEAWNRFSPKVKLQFSTGT